MGLLSWFENEQPKVVHTSQRRECWDARDKFFECLDAHSIVDAKKDDAQARKACPESVKAFESSCIDTWVDYFKQKRVVDIARQRRVEELESMGYQALEKPLDVKPR